MTRRLPAVNPKEVIRALERAGFVLHRVKGSHHYLKHPDRPNVVVNVPYHGKDLRRGTLHAIIEHAGLTIEEFLDLLRLRLPRAGELENDAAGFGGGNGERAVGAADVRHAALQQNRGRFVRIVDRHRHAGDDG